MSHGGQYILLQILCVIAEGDALIYNLYNRGLIPQSTGATRYLIWKVYGNLILHIF